MNSTPSMLSIINSTLTTIESWLIPLDIMGIICTTVVIGLSALFLFLIVLDKRCHTIPMLLVANSCLVKLIVGMDLIGMRIFTLENDLQQSSVEESFCLLQGYLLYSFSLVLAVVTNTNVVDWFIMDFGFSVSLPFLSTGQFIYTIDNQICQIPLRLSFAMVFIPLCVYITPISLIFLVYYKLFRYVHGMNRRARLVNTLARAKSELKMVRRIAVILNILFIVGFPYALFLFISYFTTSPKYHFCIAGTFVDVSLVAVLITLFHFTEPLKASLKKIFGGQVNVVIPTLT